VYESLAFEGANPLSDIWAMATLKSIGKYFIRSVRDPEDFEAKEAMLLAATMAGVGFGSAGVHLAHGVCVRERETERETGRETVRG
jgi:hydroxyacid-oxoacid transhydrogenase